MTTKIEDREGYLARMSAALDEKLKVAIHIPINARSILDVGCADGTVTEEIARRFPFAKVLGIDIDDDMIACSKPTQYNLSFQRIFLRELLAQEQRFDVIMFMSVLHEIYSYGSGVTSVVKALADAYELLNSNGVLIIRDMAGAHEANLLGTIRTQIANNRSIFDKLVDFEMRWGRINSRRKANHFLLKYFYDTNWERELRENYLHLDIHKYIDVLDLFHMEVIRADQSLLPWLANKWQTDFGFTDNQLNYLRSTMIIVARKP